MPPPYRQSDGNAGAGGGLGCGTGAANGLGGDQSSSLQPGRVVVVVANAGTSHSLCGAGCGRRVRGAGGVLPGKFLGAFRRDQDGASGKVDGGSGGASHCGESLAGTRLRAGAGGPRRWRDPGAAGQGAGGTGGVCPHARGIGADLDYRVAYRPLSHSQLPVGCEMRADQQNRDGDFQRAGAV